MDTEKVGILLVNLGSPAAPDTMAVKKYLKEFLSDTRVVDLPRILWLPLLHGIILNTRPKKVARLYKNIWGQHKLSPLVRECKSITDALNKTLKNNKNVVLGMRYGEPSISSALDSLENTVNRLIILPMFPQFSSATTASVFDKVSAYFKKKRNIPSIHYVNNYHDNTLYIKALAQSIQMHWQEYGKAEKLIISFHGLPLRYIDEGDPYKAQCETTAKLLAAQLGCEYTLTFQSRFGKEAWLEPYTDETLQKLAKDGVKSVDVISPGFSADCLETLEELAIQAKDDFLKAGGTRFSYIPALNSNSDHIELFRNLIDQINFAGSG